MDESIISDDYLLTDRFTPQYDGYKYKIDKNNEVELYLGSFGTDDTTLWINSSSIRIVKKVLNNIRLIKQEDRFKIFQCYGLNESDNNYGMKPTGYYTKSYDKIFQKNLVL